MLRKATKRVAKVDDGIRDIAQKMLQNKYSEDGIGKDAPQVGINKQILVVDTDPDEASNQPLVLINPKIIRESKQMACGQEGCLSIPGIFLDVIRPAAIEVSFKDATGRPQKIQASELLARVIQHEMDHLHGVMFVDRVENKIALAQELQKGGFSANDVKKVA
ncbi:MAG: peptide deformylase [Leptolyngbyaceae cyanobacterium]